MKNPNELYEEFKENPAFLHFWKEKETAQEKSRYGKADFSFLDKKLQDFLLSFGEKATKGLYVYGDVGVGKTYFANVLYWWLKANKNREIPYVEFFSFPDLLYRMRKNISIKRGDQDYDWECEDVIENGKMLVLDDVGVEKISDWVLEKFYLIINNRYEQNIPVFITSNCSLDQLADRVGDRIPSRLAEMCDVITLIGKDKRLK